MWQANLRLMRTHPWMGVGAGAWEVEIPRFQAEGQEIEEDYYAHNEPLQLIAEYGLVGWIFLLALAAYLLRAAWQTWRLHDSPEAPWRATALASLLGLMIVSLAGFPWRLAGTGAMFAIGLAVLAGSDLRLAKRGQEGHRPVARWIWQAGGASLGLLLLPAAWISYQAYACESRLVRAAQIAYHITLSGRHDDPAWNSRKAEMLQLLREGVAIHPHYRKLTALVADELVRWGDWDNARWVLESMAASRPHVVVILTNLGRLHAQAAEMDQAQDYLRRALLLQPRGPGVQSLQLLLLQQNGRPDEAVRLVRDLLHRGNADLGLLNQAYQLAVQRQDWLLAIEVLNQRLQRWPVTAVESWLRLAQIHALPAIGDEARALQAYRSALELLPDEQREQLRRQIPLPYRKQL
jgi:tetratricopeptide (TPR) repeat protein